MTRIKLSNKMIDIPIEQHKQEESRPTKIIYFYDHNIKLYTFVILDQYDSPIDGTEYASKNNLIKTKEYMLKVYGIKPVKDK